MRAIETLIAEHELLFKTLQSLEELLRETVRDGHLDGEAAAKILEFLERFADGSHQDKEEEFLFPRMLADASPGVRRTIGGLLQVHEGERLLLDEMRSNFEAAAYDDPWSLDLFVTQARAYIEFQRRHAALEEARLFPLAEQLLGAKADPELLAGFEEIDRRYLQRGARSPEQLVAEVCERFGSEDASSPSPHRAGAGVELGHP